MTRAEKISKIADVATVLGGIFLSNPVNINGTECDIVNKHGIMEDVCGDWCFVAYFVGEVRGADGKIVVPELTDEQVDTIFNAVRKELVRMTAMA